MRQFGQVIGEQRNLGRLNRDIRAAQPHCDTDVGGREGRSIIDAITDEGDLASFCLQALDDSAF